MIDDDLLAFIRNSIPSVWALEMLLVLRADRGREWSAGELVRELRASSSIVAESIAALSAGGLAASGPSGGYLYQPATPRNDDLAAKLADVYGSHPTAVVKEILSAPHPKIQIFADAFRFRKT